MPPTLFSKKKARASMNDSNDIWDDSLLIKAYEESIRLHKEDVAKRIALSTNKRKENMENSEQSEDEKVEEYQVGSFCRATYEDGVDYEAEIVKIEDNGTCLIRFIGYENEDCVKLEDLVPSWGQKTRDEQVKQAEIDKEYETSSEKEPEEDFQHFVMSKNNLPIPPMPPMPPALFDGSQDAEYLSAMLMSWYMSGYYTGLYHGRKQQEVQNQGQKKRKSNRN